MADKPRPRPGTYFQKVCTLHKGSFIVIHDRPCKIVEVNVKEEPDQRCTTFYFVARDIFNGDVHDYSADGNHICEVPIVDDMFYRIENIYEDGHLDLRTLSGAKKGGSDLTLPLDKNSLAQTMVDFYREGKILHVDVKSAMGEEHVTCLRELTEEPSKKFELRDREQEDFT